MDLWGNVMESSPPPPRYGTAATGGLVSGVALAC